MIRKVGYLSAFVTTAAFAASLPVSMPIQGQIGFDTMDHAAIAAEEMTVHIDQKVEHAGVIYSMSGKFYFTQPTTNDDGDQFHIGVSFPVGAKFVALYHDHPEHIDNNHFSPPDVQIANQLNVTSYVGVIDGEASHIIKYTPGKSETYHYAGGDWTTTNDLVSDGTKIAPLSL